MTVRVSTLSRWVSAGAALLLLASLSVSSATAQTVRHRRRTRRPPIVVPALRYATPRSVSDLASFQATNRALLREPKLNCLLRRRSTATYETIVGSWLLPLCDLNLSIIRVRPDELREIQQTALYE